MKRQHSPYFCDFDPARRCYVLYDYTGVGLMEECPQNQQTFIPAEAVLAIVEAAKQDNWLQGLVQTQFDKELAREHLKLLNKLVDRVPGGQQP
jgi:hypothetical protein